MAARRRSADAPGRAAGPDRRLLRDPADVDRARASSSSTDLPAPQFAPGRGPVVARAASGAGAGDRPASSWRCGRRGRLRPRLALAADRPRVRRLVLPAVDLPRVVGPRQPRRSPARPSSCCCAGSCRRPTPGRSTPAAAGGPNPPTTPATAGRCGSSRCSRSSPTCWPAWPSCATAASSWLDGDVLRNQVATDALQKTLLGATSSPLSGWVANHGWVLVPASIAALAVELGAPIALLGGRWRDGWVASRVAVPRRDRRRDGHHVPVPVVPRRLRAVLRRRDGRWPPSSVAGTVARRPRSPP